MSSHPNEKHNSKNPQSEKERIERQTIKIVRRIGYVVFFGGGLFVFIPILIGAAQGIYHDRIWDPYTDKPVSRAEVTLECTDEAQRLIYEAGQRSSLSSSWEQRYSHWLTRCRASQPEAFEMLRQTRDMVRKGTGDVNETTSPE